MARGNKFKPKVEAGVARPPPPQPPVLPSPARDGTHAASTTAAGAVPASRHSTTAAPPPKTPHTSRPPSSGAAPAGNRAKPPAYVAKPPPHASPPPKPSRLAVPTLVAPPTPGSTTATPAPVGAANWLTLKAAASIGKKHVQKPGGKKHAGGRARHLSATDSENHAAGRPHRPAGRSIHHHQADTIPSDLLPAAIGSTTAPTRILAMDCEMVGVGPGGVRSALARVCIVNDAGAVLLDTHVAPRERVTDYRTRVSGVTPACLRGAPDLATVRERVERLIANRLLVGHAITHDLTALMISHPRSHVRDTARFPPLMRATAPGRRPKPRRLRDLASEVLGLAIQGGAHSPVDDARASLYLYQRFRREWEAAAKKPGGVGKHLSAPVKAGGRAAVTAAAASAEAALGALAAQDDMADL